MPSQSRTSRIRNRKAIRASKVTWSSLCEDSSFCEPRAIERDTVQASELLLQECGQPQASHFCLLLPFQLRVSSHSELSDACPLILGASQKKREGISLAPSFLSLSVFGEKQSRRRFSACSCGGQPASQTATATQNRETSALAARLKQTEHQRCKQVAHIGKLQIQRLFSGHLACETSRQEAVQGWTHL